MLTLGASNQPTRALRRVCAWILSRQSTMLLSFMHASRSLLRLLQRVRLPGRLLPINSSGIGELTAIEKLQYAPLRRTSTALRRSRINLQSNAFNVEAYAILPLRCLGNITFTIKPGLLSASVTLAPWSSAMADTRLRPRPLPLVERLFSKR